MGSTEDAGMLALIAAVPERATPDETEAFLDAMPIAELASMWGALQRPGRRDQTGVAWVLNSLGCLCATLSAAEQAETYLSEALSIFHDLNYAVGTANLTSNLGELAEAEGHHELEGV